MQQNFLGKYAEQIIAHYFENKGYSIIAKRFKKAGGEIDLITRSQNKIVFIEVKYRKNFEDFEGIIEDKKIQRIYKTIEKFFLEYPELSVLDYSVDIIFIDKNYNITHLENI